MRKEKRTKCGREAYTPHGLSKVSHQHASLEGKLGPQTQHLQTERKRKEKKKKRKEKKKKKKKKRKRKKRK